ncbi:mandelate racemase/muconate lactonizing enzyme family protein [Xylophilus rhododendri]|uniref:mandelate racemase/muconate lactonizing enzyme family protein n=1 Tax=Xylophilus rhododendri TaxID=2697032 RepID=UPI001E33CD53|nr:mandelate racemase/muconate lactonizing enzyme family protein [Xylophilus rhododendri]
MDKFLFAKITTSDGIVGLGESGAWGHLEASAEAIRKFAEYLVGKDPRQIEHHWNVMYRFQQFSGAAIGGAISAIDVALWDIKGKHHGVPVYEMLGGAVRDKVRLYSHCKGKTPEHLLERAGILKGMGFNALGYLNPLLEEGNAKPWFKTHADKIGDATQNIAAVRHAVGSSVDICIELHNRMSPAEAITFGHMIREYLPMYIEDPIRPGNPDAMAWVADHMPVPIATGERFTNLQQFQTLLARRGAEFVRPCISVCGGITAGKKIAALAEACDAQVVFHNPLSPVNLAACLQLDAAIPNFAIQEYVYESVDYEGRDGLRGANVVEGLAAPEHGFLAIPQAPGLGVFIPEDVPGRFPGKSLSVAMRAHVDGSMVDQ